MSYTSRVSERMYPLITRDPDSYTNAVYNDAHVSCRDYHRLWFVMQVGDMVGTSTINVQLYQATQVADAGGDTKVIAGKAITQLDQAAGDGDQIVCIEVQSEEFDVDGGFDCISVRLTVGNAASELSYVLYGLASRFKEVPTTNWEEIVG